MIERLNEKKYCEVMDFLSRVNDRNQDFYITANKERKYLKGDWNLIKKVLKYQEVYGLNYDGLKGLLIIVREKGFRPYIKLLTESTKYNIDLLKFLKWNFSEIDLYCKFKRENPLATQILRTGFIRIGDRGKELLFFKKGVKSLYKLIPKDLREDKNDNRY
jgi:hypothetical protein